MKHAKINSLIAAAAIGCFAILAVIVPPTIIKGQVNKEAPIDTVKYAKYRSDSLGLEAVKFLKDVEKERVKVDSLNVAVEANKQNAEEVSKWVKYLVAKSNIKGKTKVKHIPFMVPVAVGSVNNGSQIIVNTYVAEKIPGTITRDKPNYYEWKQGRGLLQKKDSLTYIKKVYGK